MLCLEPIEWNRVFDLDKDEPIKNTNYSICNFTLRHLSNIDFPQTNLCNNEQSLNITCQVIFVWGSQYFLLPKPRFDGPVIVVQIIKSKPAQWFRYSYVIQRKVINRYMTGIWEFFVPQLTKSYSYTLLKTIRRGV